MTQYIDGIAEIPQSRCVVSEDIRTLTIPAKEHGQQQEQQPEPEPETTE